MSLKEVWSKLRLFSTTRSPSTEDLQSVYMWFFVMRIVAVVIIAIGLVVMDFFGLIEFSLGPVLFVILPALFVLNLLYWFLKRYKSLIMLFLYIQIAIDLIAITAGIYFSGGIQSEFMYLYLIPIFSVSLISLRMTVYSFLSAIFLHASVLYLEYLSRGESTLWQWFFEDVHYLTHIAVFILLLIIFSFQGYYYISRIKKKDEEILKVKDEFLFRTVHDLRSPATAIKWFIDRCAKADYAKVFPELREHVKTVKDLNERILHIIKDLADIAQGERREILLKKEKIDIRQIIKAILQETKSDIIAKSIKIKYEPLVDLPFILGDSHALKEVFSNLFNNAIKYNIQGGSIFIEHIKENNFLKTTIRDTGQGIKKKDFSKLFTPYFRGSTQEKTTGTGLGLYLSKKLTEKMGGEIKAKSKPGKGATFFVYLPIAIG